LEAERAKAEAERLAAEQAAAKAEAERLAMEQAKAEAERLAAEQAAKAEADRLAAEQARAEAERLEAERAKAEAERLALEQAAAKAEAERLEAERAKAEAERVAAELAAREAAQAAAKAEAERLAFQTEVDGRSNDLQATISLSAMETAPSAASADAAVREVSKLREWERDHEARLEDQMSKESHQKAERREHAAADLQKWHEERKSNIAKRHEQMKIDDKSLAKSLPDASRTSSNVWERIVGLIDTSSRSTISEDAKDTSRMRALLIQLKTSPPLPRKR